MVILIESFIFSGQFKDSFASTGLNPELLTIITWVLTIAGSILVLGILIQFIRKQFRPPKPVERLDDPRRIIDLLGQSLTERSRFEISYREKVLKTRGIFCTLVAVDKNELLLEVPEYATPRQAWIGRPLEAYFSLASRGNTKTYYTFESSVESIERQGSGTAYLHISLPKAISLGQRRMHFRLVPDPATILEVKVWFAQHQPRAKDHTGPVRWGPPMAHHHLLTRKNTQASLKILDISAGGCRLAVTNNARINSYLDNNRSPDVFLFFRLLDRESGNLEIYLLGKIRVIVCDPVSNSRSLGIEFTMNGQTNDKSGQYITWTSLSREEGHPKMGNWIFKQHLALFRQQEKDKQEDRA